METAEHREDARTELRLWVHAHQRRLSGLRAGGRNRAL
jgi:hypothetical protein